MVANVLWGSPLYPPIAYTIFLNAGPKVPHSLLDSPPAQNRKCGTFGQTFRKFRKLGQTISRVNFYPSRRRELQTRDVGWPILFP